MNPLHSILPKVKVIRDPKDTKLEAQLNLRKYFHLFTKRSKIKRKIPPEPKFTLYIEPFPYLLVYQPEDEDIKVKKEYYTSFRTAYRRYMLALQKHRSIEAKKNKATLL
jgi:hypothetical protein